MRKSKHYGPGKRLLAAALTLLMILTLGGFAPGDEARGEPMPLAEGGTPNLQVTLTPDTGNIVAEGNTLQYTLTVTSTGTGALTGKSKATLKIGTDTEMELGTVRGDSGVTAEPNAKLIKITADSDGVVLPAGASVSGTYIMKKCPTLPFNIQITFTSSNDSSGDDITYEFPSVTFTQAADGLTSNSGGITGPGTNGPTESPKHSLVYHLNPPSGTETDADIHTETSETSGAFSLQSVGEVFPSQCATGQYKVNGDWYFAGWNTTPAAFTTYADIDYPVTDIEEGRGFHTPPQLTVPEGGKRDVYAVWAPEGNAGLFGYVLTDGNASFDTGAVGVLGDNGLSSTGAKKYVVYDSGHSATSGSTLTVTAVEPTAPGKRFIGWYEKDATGHIALGGDKVPYGGEHGVYSLDAIWGAVSYNGGDQSFPADGDLHSIDISTLTTVFSGGGVGKLASLTKDEQGSRNACVKYTYTVTKGGAAVTADSKTADGVPQFKDAGVYQYAITATLHDPAHMRNADAQANGIEVGTVKATMTIANEAELTYHLNLPGEDATVVDANPKASGSAYTYAVKQIGEAFGDVANGYVTLGGTTYYFAGWSTNKDAKTYAELQYRVTVFKQGESDARLLADGLTYTTSASRADLYAIWLKPALLGYTMTISGASFPAEAVVQDSENKNNYVVLDGGYAEGDDVTVTGVKPTVAGGANTFVAWYDGHGTPAIRFPGETFAFGRSQSVYSLNAIWASLEAKTEQPRVNWTGDACAPTATLTLSLPGALRTNIAPLNGGLKASYAVTVAGAATASTSGAIDFNASTIAIPLPKQTNAGKYDYTVAVTFTDPSGGHPVKLEKTVSLIIDPVLHVQVDAKLMDKGVEADWGGRTFGFAMTAEGLSQGNQTLTVRSDTKTGTFGAVPFDKAGTYTFTVDEARTEDEAVIYADGQSFAVTVTDAGAYSLAGDGVSQDASGNYTKTLIFENQVAYGTLTFTHTVTHENAGAHEMPTDEVFTFRLTTDPAQANGAFTVSVDGAEPTAAQFDGSGVYTFTLDNYVYGTTPGKMAAQKTVTFSDLPAGVTYTIEPVSGEENYTTPDPESARLTSRDLAGEIGLEHIHFPGGLVIYNKVSDPYLRKIGAGESPFGAAFTFRVKAAREGQPVALEGLTPDGEGAYTFTLRDQDYQIISGLQEGDTYEITETPSVYYSASNNSGTGATASGAISFGPGGQKTLQVRFTNTLRSGDLSITKRVSGAGAPGRQFQAVLTLTAGKYAAEEWKTVAGLITKENLVRELGAGAVAGVDDVTDAGGVVTAKKLTLNITDGQTLTLHDLPAGLAYAVTENASGGFTASYADATGTIQEKPAANSVTITNFYNTSALTVKNVLGEGGSAYRAFETHVTLSGGGYGGYLNGRYSASLNKGSTSPRKDGEDIQSVTFHNGAASFSLYGGETLTIAGLPLGVGYTVAETDDAARLGYLVSYPDGQTGTMTASGNSVTVQNDYGAGALTVTKQVTGAGGDKARSFRFTVTVDGTPTVNGPRGELTFTDGVATFTLADGQTVTAPGLPAGASYTVREDPSDSEGYTVAYAGGDTADGAGGTILLGETAAITVTNHRDEPAATASPEPTATPGPTASPEPTATAAPDATPEPTAVPTVKPTDGPPATSEPFGTPEPDATASPEPTASPAPAAPTATRDPSAPVTGDGTDVVPWAAMLGLCLMGLAAVLVFRRRRS